MEVIECATAADWESWLAAHHAAREGVWLKIAKKGSARRSVTPAAATEVALCYGWIDSHRKSGDREHFLQKYSPRRPGSSWSRINVERATALIAAGRMRAKGPGSSNRLVSRCDDHLRQDIPARLEVVRFERALDLGEMVCREFQGRRMVIRIVNT